MLTEQLVPWSNQFSYGQVDSQYGSGQFIKDLTERFLGDEETVVTSRIPDRDAIMDSIKELMGGGR